MSKNPDSSQTRAWLKWTKWVGVVVFIGCIVWLSYFYWQRKNMTTAENTIKPADNHQQISIDIKELGDTQKQQSIVEQPGISKAENTDTSINTPVENNPLPIKEETSSNKPPSSPAVQGQEVHADHQAAASVEPSNPAPTEEPPQPNNPAPAAAAKPEADSTSSGTPKLAADSTPAKPAAASPDIEAKYRAQLISLKGQCEAQASSIVGEIAAYLSSQNSKDGISGSKTKYLSRISAAEASCDQKAGSIIEKAKAELRQAGLDDSGPDGWRQEYDAAKGAAQARALTQLEKQLPK